MAPFMFLWNEVFGTRWIINWVKCMINHCFLFYMIVSTLRFRCLRSLVTSMLRRKVCCIHWLEVTSCHLRNCQLFICLWSWLWLEHLSFNFSWHRSNCNCFVNRALFATSLILNITLRWFSPFSWMNIIFFVR